MVTLLAKMVKMEPTPPPPPMMKKKEKPYINKKKEVTPSIKLKIKIYTK
jgi:hypothetical protein